MNTQLQVLYEDDAILIINKPAGLIVNRSDTTIHEKTIQDFIEESEMVVIQGGDKESDFVKRSGIVHRIDKETSGILLVAKTSTAFSELQRQFKDRVVEKRYVALVHGTLSPKSGEIHLPVARLPWNRKRFGIVAGGKDSITFYTTTDTYVAKNGEVLSLMELSPKTGRTHQIRVHMKYMNHPIYSDMLYGGRKVSIQDRKILPRVFLHASKISFLHPITKKTVSVTSKLPDELIKFLSTLNKVD